MGNLYFRRDMANVLRAVASAGEGPAEERTGHNQSWHDGFEAALVAVGMGFGLQKMVSRDRCDGPTWVEMETGD